MTVEEYREKLIQVFLETGHDNLIPLVCLPNDNAFKELKSLIKGKQIIS